MKYTSKQYANALYSILKETRDSEQERVITGFLVLLQKRGEFAKRNNIAKEIERLSLKNRGMKKVEVETASPVKNIKKDVREVMGEMVEVHEKVNPEIMGGMKILLDDEVLIDASARTMINKLFVKS